MMNKKIHKRITDKLTFIKFFLTEEEVKQFESSFILASSVPDLSEDVAQHMLDNLDEDLTAYLYVYMQKMYEISLTTKSSECPTYSDNELVPVTTNPGAIFKKLVTIGTQNGIDNIATKLCTQLDGYSDSMVGDSLKKLLAIYHYFMAVSFSWPGSKFSLFNYTIVRDRETPYGIIASLKMDSATDTDGEIACIFLNDSTIRRCIIGCFNRLTTLNVHNLCILPISNYRSDKILRLVQEYILTCIDVLSIEDGEQEQLNCLDEYTEWLNKFKLREVPGVLYVNTLAKVQKVEVFLNMLLPTMETTKVNAASNLVLQRWNNDLDHFNNNFFSEAEYA